MASLEAVTDVLDFLARTKPGADLAAVDREAYYAVLGPVPDDLLEAVKVVAARLPGDFLPSAGTLYDLALDLHERMRGVPTAGEVWPLVWALATGKRVELPERAAAALVEIGGAEGWLESEKGIKRAQFAKAYEAERQAWRARAALPGGEALLALGDGR